MSTVKSLADLALDYIGVDGFGAAKPAQLRTIARMIKAATQEISAKRSDLFCLALSGTFAGPRSISVTVTANSTNIVIGETGAGYVGRTLAIAGDIEQNQISAGSAEVEGGGNTTCTLRRPYAGASGTVTALLYGDAIALPAGVAKVLGNVDLVGYGELTPAADRSELASVRDNTLRGDYGVSASRNSQHNRPDQPRAWWTETAFRPAAAGAPVATALVLRLAPIPDRTYTVEFDVTMLPTDITVEQLADSAAEITIPMPGGMGELILEPYFLQRWTGTPWFKNKDARAEIARQFTVAENTLVDYSPQSETGGRVFVGCS